MKHGDFITIDFVGKVQGTGKIFDFTQEEVARQERLHNPDHTYAPALVVIGANMVIPGVEKELVKMNPGEESSFLVSPDDAFGQRNPKLAKLFPLSAFLDKNINPSPGAFVEIEGMHGRVQSVSGGRVRVDFNHPLAGKQLSYWMKIVRHITDPKEKVGELFSYYRLPYTPVVEGEVLTVEGEKEIPHEARTFIQEAVARWVKEIKKVTFSARK